MIQVQTTIPFLSVASSAAGLASVQVGADAEQAFLAALEPVPQLASTPSAPLAASAKLASPFSAADPLPTESAKPQPKAEDAATDDERDVVSQLQPSGANSIPVVVASEIVAPTEIAPASAAVFLSSSGTVHTPTAPSDTSVSPEISGSQSAAPTALVVAHSTSVPANSAPLLSAPNLSPDRTHVVQPSVNPPPPKPKPDHAPSAPSAKLQAQTVEKPKPSANDQPVPAPLPAPFQATLQAKVPAPLNVPMSEYLISGPVDQPLAYQIGQTVTRVPAKTVPFMPAVTPAGTKSFPELPEVPEASKLPTETALPKDHQPPPPSVSVAAIPPLQQTASTPFQALHVSDVQPASGLRTASDPDGPTDSSALTAVRPASAGISQEESVLRAIWVGAGPVENPSEASSPGQGRELGPKSGMSENVTSPAIPTSQPMSKEAAPTPLPAGPSNRTETATSEPAAPTTERAKPGFELSPANPAVVGPTNAEAKPRALELDLPTDLKSDRPTGAQPFDSAVLPIATLTDRLPSLPRPEAASAPAPPSPQAPSPQAQIVQAVGTAGEQITEITLSPEELGHVRIDMRSDGDRMVMTISAERQDTLDLLRRHADDLAAEMRAAGQAGVSLSFGRWSGSGFGSAPDGQPQGAPSDPRPAPEKVPALTATFRPAISASGLYLRI